MPEATAMAGNQLNKIHLDELTGHMYPILRGPNQSHLINGNSLLKLKLEMFYPGHMSKR